MDLSFFSRFPHQFLLTLQEIRKAWPFIRKNRLYDGLLSYGWVTWLMLICALLLGLEIFQFFREWLQGVKTQSGSTTMQAWMLTFGQSLSTAWSHFGSGGIKYLVIVLVQVAINHMCLRTREVLAGEPFRHSIKVFIGSQVLSLQLGVRAFLYETIAIALLGVGLKLLSMPEFLEPVFRFPVKAFFLGYMFLGVWLKSFQVPTKHLLRYAWQYGGVCLAVGAVMFAFLAIPVLGPFAGALICGVSVTTVMHHLDPAPDPDAILTQ